jgi:hypothetical protein
MGRRKLGSVVNVSLAKPSAWVKKLLQNRRMYNVLTKTSLLERSMLQGWRDDVKAVLKGRLRHNVAQEPYFPLIQLEMLRLQVVEARSLTRATKALEFATLVLAAATIILAIHTS